MLEKVAIFLIQLKFCFRVVFFEKPSKHYILFFDHEEFVDVREKSQIFEIRESSHKHFGRIARVLDESGIDFAYIHYQYCKEIVSSSPLEDVRELARHGVYDESGGLVNEEESDSRNKPKT